MQDQSNGAQRVLQSCNDRVKALVTEVSKLLSYVFRVISAFLRGLQGGFLRRNHLAQSHVLSNI